MSDFVGATCGKVKITSTDPNATVKQAVALSEVWAEIFSKHHLEGSEGKAVTLETELKMEDGSNAKYQINVASVQ